MDLGDSMRKGLKMLVFAVVVLFSVAMSETLKSAHAIPLVYTCEIIDYTEHGVQKTEFLYTNFGHSSTFTTGRSDARVYLDQNHRLVISLRPRRATGDIRGITYTSVTAFNLPQRLQVVLGEAPIPGTSAEDFGYAALLVCRI